MRRRRRPRRGVRTESLKGTWKGDRPEAAWQGARVPRRGRPTIPPKPGPQPRALPCVQPSQARGSQASRLSENLPLGAVPAFPARDLCPPPPVPPRSLAPPGGEVLKTGLQPRTRPVPVCGASRHGPVGLRTCPRHGAVRRVAPSGPPVPPPPAVKQTPRHGRRTCKLLSPSPPCGRPKRLKQDTGPPRAVGEADLAATHRQERAMGRVACGELPTAHSGPRPASQTGCCRPVPTPVLTWPAAGAWRPGPLSCCRPGERGLDISASRVGMGWPRAGLRPAGAGKPLSNGRGVRM